MARRAQTDPAESFIRKLKDALKHYNDAAWLEHNSVLATPYYLGAALDSKDDTRGGQNRRGEVLQMVLMQAADALWPGPRPSSRRSLEAAVEEERRVQGHSGPRYRYLLLDLHYFRRYFTPRTFPTGPAAIPDFLGVSSTRYYAHLSRAIDRLGDVMLDRIQPALRLEQPAPIEAFVGRDEVQTAVLHDLAEGRTVAISGAGGVGKSSLGTAVAASYQGGPAFWYTIHPGLNDDLPSLVFAIAHFLNQHNRSMLWLQLLANEGSLGPPEQILGFLRAELDTVSGAPLFCLDEIDQLHTSDNQPRKAAHMQVLEFLESLIGYTPLLLIGQRSLIDTDSHYVLQPLAAADSAELTAQSGLHLDEEVLAHLLRYTEGNPRLLELVITFLQSGGAVEDLPALAGEAIAKPLFHRLWKRLDVAERGALSRLSVLRSYAPVNLWPDYEDALASLSHRKLVKFDNAGGVILQPFVRQLIYFDHPAEQRMLLHEEAAVLRAQLGQYTPAAFHFGEAGDDDSAVAVWYPNMEQEIRRGQGSAAGEQFLRMSAKKLDGKRGRQLMVVQNRLNLHAGEAERVLDSFEGFTWHGEEELSADAHTQFGVAFGILGRNDAAVEQYEEAISTLGRLSDKIAENHLQLGMAYLRERDNKAARRETILGRSDIDRLQGIIAYTTGDLDSARRYFDSALSFAAAAEDRNRVAVARQHLAMVAGRLADSETARRHADAAVEIFNEIGNRLKAEGVRAEFAGVYLNLRQFDTYIELAERSLRFFEQIKHERWISVLSNNLAEAYLEVGDHERAKAYAYRVLRLENPPSMPYTHYTLGLLFEREQKYEDAEKTLQQGVDLARQVEDRFIEAYLLRALGRLYVGQGKAEKGRELLDTAVDLFQQMGLEREVQSTLEAG